VSVPLLLIRALAVSAPNREALCCALTERPLLMLMVGLSVGEALGGEETVKEELTLAEVLALGSPWLADTEMLGAELWEEL